MTTVKELIPGDIVDGPAGLGSATFVTATDHPIYSGLKLVVWVMSDGSISLDALSLFQEVGSARRADHTLRKAALLKALISGANS